MEDPILLAAVALGLVCLLVFSLVFSPRFLVLVTAGYLIFFPKLGVLPIPGTTVAVRGEDILLALLFQRVLVDLTSRRFTLPALAKQITWWLLALLPIGLIGIIMGVGNGLLDSPAVAFLFLARRYEYFVLFLAGALYFQGWPRWRHALLRMLVVSVHVNLLLAILQAGGVIGGFRYGTYHMEVADRVMGMFAGAYELAAYSVMLLPLFLWRLLRTEHRLSGLAGCLAIALTVWLTQARIAVIAGTLILVLMLLRLARRRLLIPTVGLTAVITAYAIAPTIRPTASSQSRFGTLDISDMWQATLAAYARRDYHNIGDFTLHSTITDVSYAMRIDRWFNYLDGLIEFNPLFGLGPSVGGEAMDSNYVRLLLEFGILGLVVFLILLWTIARAAISIPAGPYRVIAVWGGLGLLTQALFIDVFEASKVAEPYWLILGVGLASAAHVAHGRDSGASESRTTRAHESHETSPGAPPGRRQADSIAVLHAR